VKAKATVSVLFNGNYHEHLPTEQLSAKVLE
jgi:hypothetical protein